MKTLKHLFESNERWAQRRVAADPEYFARLSRQQAPDYLWIGCADSRVPANEIVGLEPGELFVHRNIANVVSHMDLSVLSCLQYAVDNLGVEHVIVAGHYGCGGVRGAYEDGVRGIADTWVRGIRDLYQANHGDFAGLDDVRAVDRLCELNVAEQVRNVCRTRTVRDAWSRGRPLAVHGWIYRLEDGRIRDLGVYAASQEDANALGALG